MIDHGKFTGRTAGWMASQFEGPPEHWEWWARVDEAVSTGTEATWARAVGAAKRAYSQLEATAHLA